MAVWPFTNCSDCCPIMNCDGQPVSDLAFTASVAGSCPQAAVTVLTGTATGGLITCEEYCTGNPCLCAFVYNIDPAAIPDCQPVIGHVTLRCEDAGYQPLASGCDHVRYQKKIWYGEVGVLSADLVAGPAHNCPAGPVGSPETFPFQDADCVWQCLEGGPFPNDGCNMDCPPCAPCHKPARCAANLECCGSTGCPKCSPCIVEGGTLPPCTAECDPQCSHCWATATGDPVMKSCAGCTFSYSQRIYHFWGATCPPDTIKGCNPTGCPPDPDNYSSFYIKFDCGDDWLEFRCPITGEMVRLHRRLPPNRKLIAELVRRMPAERVAELLRKLGASHETERRSEADERQGDRH
jgi:hypothetical protein